jgi:hypothetical protein
VTNWAAHARFVPLTTITLTPSGFDAFTGVGPIGFNDPMQIVQWDPPRLCRLVKRGRIVRGWAELSVSQAPSGSRVQWSEEIRVIGVPTALDPLVAVASRRLFSRVIDGLLG